MTSSGSRGCDQGSDDQVGWASCPGIRPNVALSEKVYISLLPEGAFIQANGAYIPKFAELLKLRKRRFKGLPHHPTLEPYQADQQL